MKPLKKSLPHDAPERAMYELSRRSLLRFTQYLWPQFKATHFHTMYYKILDMFAKGQIKNLIVTIPPQHGKALSVDTPILTTKGWKKHGELQPGDYVFGESGNPVKVLENHGVIMHESAIVHFQSGEKITASINHEWDIECDREKYRDKKCGTNTRKRELIETQHLMTGQRRSPAIMADITLSMPERKLPIEPYLLGCWLGDGYSASGNICSGIEDAEHFSKLGIARLRRKDYYVIHIEGLSRLLRLNNLINNKHIPTEYLLASYSQRLELLRGLMDTDGCVDSKGRCEFTQKDNGLADDVYTLMRSLGMKPTIHTYAMKLNGSVVGVKKRVFVSKPNERIFNLKRKADKQQYNQRVDATRFFINAVENIGKRLVNCITVEGGLYLAGKELILTHNSQGSSKYLPAYMLGLNPNLNIALMSYSTTFARKFNRHLQRVIDTQEYHNIFPTTKINSSNIATVSRGFLRNADEFEIIDYTGSFKAIGREGALTGNPVDVMIFDDLYKDAMEGNSPVVRDNVIEMYKTVAETRLHNDSQQLCVFTRWHEEDLIGYFEKTYNVVTLTSFKQVEAITDWSETWVKINYEALKASDPTELDPREMGEALFPERHNRTKLLISQKADPIVFNCMYQGEPTPKEGLLYSAFKTYTTLPDVKSRNNYTDTADQGDDYLCSICYSQGLDNIIYVTDVIYTQESMEQTEVTVPMMFKRNSTIKAYVESNNGGRGFARAIQKASRTMVEWFHQSRNKEARILTNAAAVNANIVMPVDWASRWPVFHNHVTTYKRLFKANKHDDAADCLTGIIEKEMHAEKIIPSIPQRARL